MGMAKDGICPRSHASNVDSRKGSLDPAHRRLVKAVQHAHWLVEVIAIRQSHTQSPMVPSRAHSLFPLALRQTKFLVSCIGPNIVALHHPCLQIAYTRRQYLS